VSPRYGQLSYTSYDVAGTAGGWQVKQTTGELTADETELLVAGVRTVFHAVEPLPAYPTPEDCERGPRRLAYRRTPDDAGAFWHTVPAGADSTGRPGNVFAHVVLDRRPDDGVGHRPIQLWRSPAWVRPYGAGAVARAAIPKDPPATAGLVTKDSVLAFVMDTSTWRLGTLCGLLDAVLAAMDGGPPVVLGTDSDEHAAQWIGLVSFLMSPGTATSLGFSTFDRADQVSANARNGQHLTAVPLADLAALPPHVVVIDETAMLSMGELDGEPHRTPAGQTIEVTPWSAMVQVTLVDAESGSVVIDDIVRYAAEAGDHGLHPAWPMAMSVLHRDDFADARDEANAIIGRFSPTGLSTESALGQAVSGALAELVGSSTAQAWRAVQQAPGGRAAEHADVVYLCRAIGDPDWLAQVAMIPVSPRNYAERAVPSELSAAIGPALDRAAAAGPEPLARLVDLLLRAGVRDERLAATLTNPALPATLMDPRTGPELARRLGQRISVSTRLTIAAETLLASGPGHDATTPLSDGVLDWLTDGIGVPAPTELASAQPWDPTWTRAALRGAYAQRFGAANDADRFAQLWWLRLCGAARFDQLAGSAIWNPVDLRVAAAGVPLTAEATLPTLLGAPPSPELDELATEVMDTSPDLIASACAAVRAIDPRVWVQQGYIEAHQAEYTPLWEQAMNRVGMGGVHSDFGVRLLTLAVVANVSGKPYPAQSVMLAADAATADAAVEHALSLVDQQVLVPAAVLAASLVPQTGEDVSEPVIGVDGVVRAVAQQLVATREFGDEDVDAAVSLMAQMTGLGADEAPRRYRKMVHKLLSQRPEGQSSRAARIRGSR
jgi:hypothetical protein